MKKAAMGLLAMAIATIALSFWFSQRAAAIQGPSALAVMDDQAVWLSVDEQLWQLSADGRLLAAIDTAALGVQGRVGSIARHPSGQLALGAAGQQALVLFDPGTGKIASSLLPQWPPALGPRTLQTLYCAFGPGGELAIATGGGHAVALFDATGGFLRQTPAGLYRFTNGLWWQGGSLWTTNTNGFALIELTPESMTPARQVLLAAGARERFLGMAKASEGQARSPASSDKPFATVARFDNNMVAGRMVDVFADGTEREFKGSAGLEPRDLAWHQGRLLAVDGRSFTVKQFGGDGQALADFGDAAVQARLQGLVEAKARFRLGYWACLGLGAVLFLAGLGLAVRADHLQRRVQGAGAITPASLGMPLLDKGTLLRKSLLLSAPALVVFALLVGWTLSQGSMPIGVRHWTAVGPGRLVVMAVAWLVLMAYFGRAVNWAGSRAGWEQVVNWQALQFLSRADLTLLLEPGEGVRETLVLRGFPGVWLVLTQRRVLVFAINRRDRALRLALDNTTVSQVRLLHWRQLGWAQRLKAFLVAGAARLELSVAGKPVVAGYVGSTLTAERIVALLALHAGRVSRHPPAQPSALANRSAGHWRWQALASALVPGLGQWMQRRPGTALTLFLLFALMLCFATLPMVWTWYGARAAISTTSVVLVADFHIALALLSAWDCWNMRRR